MFIMNLNSVSLSYHMMIIMKINIQHRLKFQEQKQHLARILAIQLTKEGEGPGVQYIKAEKQKLYMGKYLLIQPFKCMP